MRTRPGFALWEVFVQPIPQLDHFLVGQKVILHQVYPKSGLYPHTANLAWPEPKLCGTNPHHLTHPNHPPAKYGIRS